MKEFKKYDKKYCDRKTSHCCLSLDIYCEHCAELRKMGWQAALEEVLKQLNNIYNGDFENSDIVKYIEEELNT